MKHTELWMDYFTAVNIHLNHNNPFWQLCNKIEPFMIEADKFNLVIENYYLDKYKLLQLFWQAIDPDMNKTAMEIAKNQYNVSNIDLT